VEVGLVGLSRKGANMARRWRRHGHTVVGYARTAATVEGLVADGAIDAGAKSLEDPADRDVHAGTGPLRDPELHQHRFGVAEVTELWRRGSVIASLLLDHTAQATVTDPDLDCAFR